MITETERGEARLAKRLWELGKPDVFAGVTKPDDVRRRIRAAILGQHVGQNIGHIVAFRKDNDDPVTLETAFFLTYQEPLIREIEAA